MTDPEVVLLIFNLHLNGYDHDLRLKADIDFGVSAQSSRPRLGRWTMVQQEQFVIYGDSVDHSCSRGTTVQRARRGLWSALSVLMARSSNPPRAYCDLLRLA